MESLPKRSDDIYKEIESFEEYELTQCVAYEMAIRNDDNLKAIEEVVKYWNDNNEDISKIYQTMQEKINAIDCIDWRYNDTRLSDINEIIKKVNDFSEKSKRNFETTSLSTDKSKIEIREGKGYSVYTNLISYGSSYVSNGLHIFDNFKRPKLNINPLNSRSATIELDLNKPLSELKAYITHVYKDLENNKENNKDILKAPLELLGKTLDDAIPQKDYPKKPTAKKMADMFFIYDFVKARRNEIKAYNDEVQKKYDEKISYIVNDKDLSTKHKKIQKSEMKTDYLNDTLDTKIIDIFNENEVTKPLNLSGAHISKLYYAINPYIDDLKYKELITRVSTI